MNANQNEQLSQLKKPDLYRFRLMQGQVSNDGKFERTKTVGMVYHVEGARNYTLKLWTFLKDRFVLMPRRNDPSQFLLLTREWNNNPSAKNKTYSNIVGNGSTDTTLGVIKIEFDLFDKPLYMSIYPEPVTISSRLQQPEVVDEAA